MPILFRSKPEGSSIMSIADFVFPPAQKGHVGNILEIRISGKPVALMTTDIPLSSPQLRMGMVASEILPLMEDMGVSSISFNCPLFVRDEESWDNAQSGEDYIRLMEQGTIPTGQSVSFADLDAWGVLDNPEQFLLSDEPNVYIDGTPVFFN